MMIVRWSILFYAAALTARAANSMTIDVSPLNARYITIMTSEDKGFDAAIKELLPTGIAEAALTVKPYLFVVSNPSRRTVVAYCLKFIFKMDDGSTHAESALLSDPTAALTGLPTITGQYEQLTPGRRRVVSTRMVFNSEARFNDVSWIPTYNEWIKQMVPPSRVGRLQIEANAVILDDGSLSGPDSSDLASDLSNSVSGMRQVIKTVIAEFDAGKSLDESFTRLHNKRNRELETLAKRPDAPELTVAPNAFGFVQLLWRRNGDEVFVKMARRILSAPPFVVRRID